MTRPLAATLAVPALACLMGACLTGGCLGRLDLPADADIRCADDVCPTGLVCVAGQCVGADGPCLREDGGLVADGTPCPEGLCVAGGCAPSSCGDGYADPAAGEVCDPAQDPLCGDDCRPALCGDRVVGPGETCDPPGGGCNACVRECDDDKAECDLDPATVCECASEIALGLQDDEILFDDGALAPGGAYVVASNFDVSRLYFVPDGAAPVLVDEATGFLSLARDETDGAVYAMSRSLGTSRLLALTGANVNVVSLVTSRALAGLAARDGRLYSDDGEEGVAVYDATNGAEVEVVAPECAEPSRFILCGDELACVPLEGDTRLRAAPLAGGAARILDEAADPSFGCVTSTDGVARVQWHDGINLFMDLGGAGRVALRALPPSLGDDDGLLVVLSILPFAGGALLSDLGAFGITTWRYDFDRQDLLGIASGTALAADDDRVLLDDGAFIRVVRR